MASRKTVRRSVALPQSTVDELFSVAPEELRDNFNGLVRAAIDEFIHKREQDLFEQSMAAMASDLNCVRESRRIEAEFRPAEEDGL